MPRRNVWKKHRGRALLCDRRIKVAAVAAATAITDSDGRHGHGGR